MIGLWRDAYAGRSAIGGDRAIERAVQRIAGFAPRIPLRELFPDLEIVKRGSKFEQARVRMVNQLHKWEDDQLDPELHSRVERSEERRVGKEGVRTGRSRWGQENYKKKTTKS